MKNNIESYYSRGKLLLSGEYLVLKGAKALALPVNLGQKLEICYTNSGTIDWISFEKETPFFTASFKLPSLEIIETNNTKNAQYIKSVLHAAVNLNKHFLKYQSGFAVKASIEFNLNWGLGSSSTLINNIAQWAKVNAFELNPLVSNGSGYDIACAQQNKALIFKLKNRKPSIKTAEFNPPFLKLLHLVHLNKKEATEKNIANFNSSDKNYSAEISALNKITLAMIKCQSLSAFIQLLDKHEKLIAKTVQKTSIMDSLFSDFNGQVKSLGAWGGDFALVASALPVNEQLAYFTAKGFHTFSPLINLLVTDNE